MKKFPLILMGILTFTVIVTYINAQGNNPTRLQFTEFLQGTVAQVTPKYYGEWIAYNDEAVPEGSLQGDLVDLVMFSIVFDRRFNEYEEISFIDGNWTFLSSDGSSMSGYFMGKGTNLTVFSGRFVTTMSQKSSPGRYSNAKISGEFKCWFVFVQVPPYSNSYWSYEAWWNGTLRGGES